MRPTALLALLAACAPVPPANDSDTDVGSSGDPGATEPATSEPATSEPTTAGPGPLEPADDHLRLRVDDAGEVGRLLGWNLGRGTLYAPAGDPLHPEWRTPVMQSAVAQLAEVRTPSLRPYVRFSGLQIDGALGGDGYHHFDWVDPARGVAPTDNMASFEYFAVIAELEAEPLITLNFGSGTAAEAARYVTHLSGTDPADPDVAARQHWGREDPWFTRRFEIGNEVYGFWNTGHAVAGSSYANPDAPSGGDPPWHGKPSADPADYAARALEYVAAVRAAHPDARFWVPLAQASLDAWGGPAAALAGLAPLLEDPAVEAAVVHHYQIDDGRTLGWDGADEPAFLLGGSEAFRAGYLDLLARLAQVPRPPGNPLQLAITEYHVAGAFSKGQFDRADQAIVGLGLADAQILFAQLRIDHAAQHLALGFEATDELLFEPWYNPFRATGDAATAMPSHVVNRMIAAHLLPRHATLDVVGQVSWDMSVGTATVAVPAVHAVAFRDFGAATILALHRDLTGPRRVTLDLPDGWAVDEATQYAPAAVDQDALAQPVEPTALDWQQAGIRVELVLAPHSLAALRLSNPSCDLAPRPAPPAGTPRDKLDLPPSPTC